MRGWRWDKNRRCEWGARAVWRGFCSARLIASIVGGTLLAGLHSVPALGGIYAYQGPQVTIPYGSSVSVAIDVSGEAGPLTALSIALNIQGGRNADISVLLRAPGENAPYIYLINRPGAGYSPNYNYNNDRGFLIILSDSAAYDVHRYREYNPVIRDGVLTGTWQPDGRNISPNSSSGEFATAARVSLAQVFAGVNPVGRWILELQDWHPGGQQSTLMGWSLEITAVPEPVIPALTIFVVVLLLGLTVWNWRWIRVAFQKAHKITVRCLVQA